MCVCVDSVCIQIYMCLCVGVCDCVCVCVCVTLERRFIKGHFGSHSLAHSQMHCTRRIAVRLVRDGVEPITEIICTLLPISIRFSFFYKYFFPFYQMEDNSSVEADSLNDDESRFKAILYGRARHERADSVTPKILEERLSHLKACSAVPDSPEIVAGASKLLKEGFGSKARVKNVYSPLETGAGGHGQHLASVTRDWPIFQHLLPEIAFAGHSNSGKSTLINALIGVPPRLGPANISDRAGWTDAISFYQVSAFSFLYIPRWALSLTTAILS